MSLAVLFRFLCFRVLVVAVVVAFSYSTVFASSVVLAQAGAFQRGEFLATPHRIQYGFLKVDPAKTHQLDSSSVLGALREKVSVEYLGLELNSPSLPVVLEVPRIFEKAVLVYQIGALAEGWQGAQEFLSSPRFLDLRDSDGEFVAIPIENSAHYDFRPEYYSIRGCRVLRVAEIEEFRHKGFGYCPEVATSSLLQKIEFGYTEKSAAESLSQHDSLEIRGEGMIDFWGERHNNGYKGSMYRLFAQWVRLPRGKNLIFKGTYWSASDAQTHETPLMFLENRHDSDLN